MDDNIVSSTGVLTAVLVTAYTGFYINRIAIDRPS